MNKFLILFASLLAAPACAADIYTVDPRHTWPVPRPRVRCSISCGDFFIFFVLSLSFKCSRSLLSSKFALIDYGFSMISRPFHTMGAFCCGQCVCCPCACWVTR